MDKFIIKPSIEPTNDYDKAKNEFIQACISINKLSPQEKERLFNELVTQSSISAFIDFINHCR
ncbi:MAG: hypothetical protein IJZ95_07455 [Oscillospiraceae bacterium]|nr:hypothetical protein [Oscillospiraceae bacterium]